jgi:hypothetical protein
VVVPADERAKPFPHWPRRSAGFFLKMPWMTARIRRLPEVAALAEALAPDDAADLIQHSPDERSVLLSLWMIRIGVK